MSKLNKLVFLAVLNVLYLSFSSLSLTAQESYGSRMSANPNQTSAKAYGKISGKVIDASTNTELQYVNVAILNKKDSSLVNGTITDEHGRFDLREAYGKYLLRFSFIGYKDFYRPIEINKSNISLDTIKLDIGYETLAGVEITAERSMMEYQLDKRVVNVDKNIVSAGGSASEVLENVPSVSVDQDGNVSLRGSSNVNVLIDGKPSELLGNDLATVLEQIPASSIENIEVITNPSAKYNPEGMSGIINIVLKEKGNRGFNGNISAAAGVGINKKNDLGDFLFPQGNLSLGLNYSTKKYALFFNADARYFSGSNISFSDNSTSYNNIITNNLQDRYSDNNRLGRGFKIGGDWYINNKNTLSLSYNLRKGGSFPGNQDQERLYSWEKDNPLDTSNKNNYYGLEESVRRMLFQNLTLSYEKKFDNKDQVLTIDANFNAGSFGGDVVQTRSFDKNSPENYYLKNTSESKNKRVYFTANYAHPFNKQAKLEVGYNLNYMNNKSIYDYFASRDGIRDDSMSYDFNYQEQIHALYSTFGYTFNERLSAQIGLRAEEVIRDGSKIQNSQTHIFPKDKDKKDYFSLFPTLHISYNLEGNQSAQISYSKRIRRPNPWNLSPYIDINNPANIRFGNPDLMPEYTDAFEIGYNKIFPTTSVFVSLYYRRTNDAITHLNFLWNQENAIKYGFDWVWDVAGVEYADGVRIARTSKNLAVSTNFGAELIIDQQITKWWKVNLSGNLFGNYADGRKFGGQLVETFTWDAKFNSNMTLPKNWVIQLSGQYIPKRDNIQGYSSKMYWADLAVKKDILNKKGSLSLRFSDIFNTRKRASYTFSENFSQYSTRERASQAIILSFSYRFGVANRDQMQRQRKRQASEQGEGMEIISED